MASRGGGTNVARHLMRGAWAWSSGAVIGDTEGAVSIIVHNNVKMSAVASLLVFNLWFSP